MRGRRLAELLPAKALLSLPAGCHADGRGLYLLVTPGGSRRWVLRISVKGGRRREIGLGSLLDVPLEEARATAATMRRDARMGRDPIVERRARGAQSVTFEQTFDSLFASKQRSLGNAKHLAQWPSTMQAYVFPRIGDRPVAEIDSGEVIAVLEPIWYTKPETARRVLQRMSAVFETAILRNWRQRASPCIGVVQALGGTRHRVVRHHRALPYEEVPSFLHELRDCSARPTTKLAFEWLILTATRSGETRGATWSEIDEARAEWVIPGNRMKGTRADRREFRVPLSRRCMDILKELTALQGRTGLLFPSHRTRKILSDMTFTELLRDLEFGDRATAHGFRSSFRDWASEREKVREVVAEAALAHSIRNRTEAAYRRALYLDERRLLMERWAAFLQSDIDKPLGEMSLPLPHRHEGSQTNHHG
jgi:integrase